MVRYGNIAARLIALAVALACGSAAWGQTCPTTQSTPGLTAGGNIFGRLAAQWNSYFAAKADANNGVLCNPTIIGNTGLSVLVAPGLANAPGTRNGATLPVGAGQVIYQQRWPVTKGANYTVNSDLGGISDVGTLLIATANGVTFTLPNPSAATEGNTYHFGSDGLHTYSLATAGGAATFYGCAASAPTAAIALGESIDVVDTGTQYWCTPQGATGAITVAPGKHLTVSNTLTLAGTDGSTLNVGSGGTIAAVGYSGSASDLGAGTLPNARLVNIPNSALANSAMTLAGHVVSLGGTQAFAAADLSNGVTGSGQVVLAGSPTLVTPNLGVASAASLNGNIITAGTGTLTLAAGKIFTASNTLTLAGTDGSTLNVGSGGTLGTAAFVNTGTSGGTVPLLNASPTVTGAWTYTPAANASAITISGYSLTGSATVAGLSLTGTLNTTGVVSCVICETITTTAYGANSALWLLNGGVAGTTSYLAVLANGNIGLGTATPTDLANPTLIATSKLIDVTGVNPIVSLHNTSDVLKEFDILNHTSGVYITLSGAATASNNAITFRTSNTASNNSALISALTIASSGNATFGAQVIVPNMTQSSAAQSGTVCFAAAGLTYDATLGCLASTERIKRDIERGLAGSLDAVMALRPATFRYRPGYDMGREGTQVGLIAEDVAAVDRRLVSYDDDGSPRGWNQSAMIAELVAAVQELKYEVDGLRLNSGSH